jgi:hypothetical protein
MTHSPTFTAVEPHPLIEQAHGNGIGRQLLELSRMIAIPVVTRQGAKVGLIVLGVIALGLTKAPELPIGHSIRGSF